MTATEITSEAEPTPAAAPPRSSLKSIAVVTGMTVGQLLVQFGLQLLLAKYFGATAEMDAYVAALAVPVLIATILAGSIGYVLVPAVAKLQAAGNEREAAATITQSGVWLAIVAFVVTAAVVLFAKPLTVLLCPGFDAAEQRLAAELLTASAPLIVLNTLSSFLYALFHAYGRFAAPARAGMVGTLITVGYVAVMHERQGIFAVAWAVVIGAATTVALLSPLFFEKCWFARVSMFRPQPQMGRMLRLLFPLVAASLFWRLDPLLDRYLGSRLPTGSLAHIGYAWRLIGGLMVIGTSGLSVVAFPAIAAHAAAGRREELNRELAYAMRFFVVLMTPICVGVAAFAQPVVRLLFEHGKFTGSDSAAVAWLVAIYVGAIFGAGLGDVVSRTFYAQHDTLTPVIVSAVVFGIAAGLKIALVGSQGATALVAATSLYFVANAGVLLVVLVRRMTPAILAGVAAAALRAVLGSVVACLVAALVLRWPSVWVVLPAAACAAVTYLLSLRLMGDEFAMRMTGTLFNRAAASA